ncbi:hypothetical protein Xsto_03859 [Xenorhabdus stockiae]|uniref:Uncharacterized protein n=1 Tax=Xenorhabdus stockiae TaxID=351614 RepID=A0A2D0KB12_9GAMM|nr:hypothetical protein [Xenorhabdus stockiae]PHM60583.1 hypothetical protein Xsto_03859 [Xenorhabdus stockiae]
MNLKQNNDLIITKLSTFTLILLDGKREGELFANGNMQLGIAIDILAADVNSYKVTLSPEQLDSIELIDTVTHENLTGDWTYSSEENDYSHTYPRGDVTRGINLSSGRDTTIDNESQRKVYWLKTKKEETKKIIAKITLCGKEYLSDHAHAEGSHIVVHGRRAIVYDSSDLGHEVALRIDSGKYEYKTTVIKHYIDGDDVPQSPSYKYFEWIKNNYYIYPMNNGQKVDVQDVEIQNTINDNNPPMYDYLRFTHHTRANHFYLWFLWGLYQDKKIAGAEYRRWEYQYCQYFSVLNEATPQVRIVTKPHEKKAISMSRLYFESPEDGFWKDKNDQIPKFKFHDLYGNESVLLEIIMDDADSFHFLDAE